jgi:hypothetical protein
MQKHGFTTNVLAGTVIALALAVTAQAQNSRSFVATTGNDANNCSSSAYCRTFTAALAVTNPGGEIVVVDSGGYGPATITQTVIITAIGVDASITQTAEYENALTINTTGNVTITGLNLFGGTGSNGVTVLAVGFLRLYNVQIQNFYFGIQFIASGNLTVYDSKITDCHSYGLYLANAGAKAYVHNTAFDNNGTAGEVTAGGTLVIADSSAHYNQTAFFAEGGTMALYNDHVISNAAGIGVSGSSDILGPGKMYFADGLVSDNTSPYYAGPGGTLAGSSPGTSLITPGQATSGTLSTATVLQ